jgi:putative transposase
MWSGVFSCAGYVAQLKTPYHAKRPNAICERFLGSVRRACLDHVLILREKLLHRVLRAYVTYFNQARPPQGLRQQVPQGKSPPCRQIRGVIESSRFQW